ncbi:MAG: MG2 domain-containing protein [Pirellulaceae bacterium]
MPRSSTCMFVLAKFSFILVVAQLMSWNALSAAPPQREPLWKEVESAMNKGLPKTAIEKLEPIIEGALRDKAYAEAIRAIGQKIALEGNIQGNKPEEKITRMESAIDAAPAEMKPVMQAVLANWYWQYFQQNRWRFMQRTETEQPPGEDFTTWALPQILAEIDKHFATALAQAETLKQTPIEQYSELLTEGTVPDDYRPTMYDFIVYDAIDFYAAGEQAGSRSQDAFDLSADSPIFSSTDDFVSWQPNTSDDESPTLEAIRLYQALMRFHADDANQAAFMDADLSRLVFGKNKAYGDQTNSRYKAALRRFIDDHQPHPIAARATYELARTVHDEGDWVAAHQIARRGLAMAAESYGGKQCFNLIQQIEAPSSSITTDRVWNTPRPTIDVEYRNLSKVYFRLIPFSLEQLLAAGREHATQLNRNERNELLRRDPVRSWSADLPATDDYQPRTEAVALPKDLPAGSYLLISSHNAAFSEEDNQIAFSEVWVSDLAIVTRIPHGKGLIEGFVLDAQSGEPIQDAQVKGWHRVRNQNPNANFVFQPLPAATTDAEGRFRFEGNELTSFVALASHRNQTLGTSNRLHAYSNNRANLANRYTTFFTDRSIYRPGQTIRYKGISMQVDHEANNYETLAGLKVDVVFTDVNGEEITRATHRTNDYGSFSGSFTAPRDRLTGSMMIHVDGDAGGSTRVNVEEYKRPKFKVTLDSPEEAPKLGGEVKLQGTATAYTGAAIGGAEVRYRVVREVNYPYWWWWRYSWMHPTSNESQEIEHGTTTTGPDGRFDIQFVAKPDPSADKEGQPTFHFTVYADVVDTTGETRSDQTSIRVGFVALAASMSVDDWLTADEAVEITIKTTTLDGEGQSATGTVKVHALEQPDAVHRADWRDSRNAYGGRRRVAANDEPQKDLSDPKNWPLGEEVFVSDFKTDGAGNGSIAASLKAGVYRAVLETKDRFGNDVTAMTEMLVIDPDAKQLEIKIPFLMQAATWSVEPGETFTAVWGTGYDRGRAYVEVVHNDQLLQSYWTDPDATQVQIKQPIDESMRGGLMLRVMMVRENRAYITQSQIQVPWTNKELDIRWEHFVSKLKPAQEETWTAIISDADSHRVAAEMVAGLYDASLDAFQMHGWPTSIGTFRQNYDEIQTQFENQQQTLHRLAGHWEVASLAATLSYRSFPPDLISNWWGYRSGRRYQMRGARMLGEMRSEAAPMDGAAPMAAAELSDASAAFGASGRGSGWHGWGSVVEAVGGDCQRRRRCGRRSKRCRPRQYFSAKESSGNRLLFSASTCRGRRHGPDAFYDAGSFNRMEVLGICA